MRLDDHRPASGSAQRHPRLLRGRAEPGHHGHERLGRARAGVVAEPPGEPGHHGRAADGPRTVHGRAATPDERPRLWARWAEYDGESARELGRPPPARDRGRHPRAAGLDGALRREVLKAITDDSNRHDCDHVLLQRRRRVRGTARPAAGQALRGQAAVREGLAMRFTPASLRPLRRRRPLRGGEPRRIGMDPDRHDADASASRSAAATCGPFATALSRRRTRSGRSSRLHRPSAARSSSTPTRARVNAAHAGNHL